MPKSPILLASLLVASASIAPLSQAQESSAPKPKTHKTRSSSREQKELDELNERCLKLEQQLDRVEKLLAGKTADLQQAQATAAKAQTTADTANATATQAATEIKAITPAAAQTTETVTALQGNVADLKANTTTLQTELAATRQELVEPNSLHFRGVELTPGGFLAAETVNRQRGIGGDINTQFNGIPFAGQTAAQLSEFNATGRQSRLSLMIAGKLSHATLRGYIETDFLSAGSTSNDNQSNSYPLRVRQAWAQAELEHGTTVTAGQMWSLATEFRSGLTNTREAIPLTIDAQYNAGFTWERQYGFRVTKRIGDHLWIGGAAEASQTLNVGGHNLPVIAFQQAGNAGGLYNPLANYSFNYAPDLIAKIAYENKYGHFEVFGVGRFFRDRVFPNAGLIPASATPALGAFTSKAQGGGIGVNGHIQLLDKKLEVGAHILAGNGLGRYGSSTLPDATAHPSGSLELLTSGSALASLEYHSNPRLDLYAYYGGDFVKRAFYNTGTFVTTPPTSPLQPPLGQPILGGYGAPTNIVLGCHTEVVPVASANGGGNVPGTAAGCTADTRNIQEGTLGYWYRFYRGSHGTLQQGVQYSYLVRHTWQGVGDPLSGLGGSPKAIDNMFFTSFRYYLPTPEAKQSK